MRRSAGTVERACELVGAALVWGHNVHVTVTAPAKGGRPSYTVETIGAPQDEPERRVRPLETA